MARDTGPGDSVGSDPSCACSLSNLVTMFLSLHPCLSPLCHLQIARLLPMIQEIVRPRSQSGTRAGSQPSSTSDRAAPSRAALVCESPLRILSEEGQGRDGKGLPPWQWGDVTPWGLAAGVSCGLGGRGPLPPGSRLALVGADCVYTFPARPAQAPFVPGVSSVPVSLQSVHLQGLLRKSLPS